MLMPYHTTAEQIIITPVVSVLISYDVLWLHIMLLTSLPH